MGSSRYGNAWVNPSPASRYGGAFLSDRVGSGAESTGLAGVATAPAGVTTAKRTSPDSPMFWVAALVLVVFGVGGVSTTVRLGKEKAHVQLGQT
jgi:hypothetical protein